MYDYASIRQASHVYISIPSSNELHSSWLLQPSLLEILLSQTKSSFFFVTPFKLEFLITFRQSVRSTISQETSQNFSFQLTMFSSLIDFHCITTVSSMLDVRISLDPLFTWFDMQEARLQTMFRTVHSRSLTWEEYITNASRRCSMQPTCATSSCAWIRWMSAWQYVIPPWPVS